MNFISPAKIIQPCVESKFIRYYLTILFYARGPFVVIKLFFVAWRQKRAVADCVGFNLFCIFAPIQNL